MITSNVIVGEEIPIYRKGKSFIAVLGISRLFNGQRQEEKLIVQILRDKTLDIMIDVVDRKMLALSLRDKGVKNSIDVSSDIYTLVMQRVAEMAA